MGRTTRIGRVRPQAATGLSQAARPVTSPANPPEPAIRSSARFAQLGGRVPNRNDRGAVMARQFIFHMQGLSKTFPGNRKVLENINLSFYPDAKIGVLGVNGAGKSTLLRIMAGIDTDNG